MKTRELIRLLEEEDPTGDLECCVGNVDIWTVQSEPAYYDGPLQVLRRNQYSNIIGGDYVKSGTKVVLDTYPLSTLAYLHPELPIGFIGYQGSEPEQEALRAQCRDARMRAQKDGTEAEFDYFSTHVWSRLRCEAWFLANKAHLHDSREYDAIRAKIREWFDANIRRDAPHPRLEGMSYVECRNQQWADTVRVELIDGRLELGWRESASAK